MNGDMMSAQQNSSALVMNPIFIWSRVVLLCQYQLVWVNSFHIYLQPGKAGLQAYIKHLNMVWH